MSKLKKARPSPAMVVALIALVAALAGTAYAAQTINGGAIKKQTIGGGKLKQKTLTGYQINVNKLGTVPTARSAIRASHTYWAVVNNPPSRSTSAAAPTSPAATTPAPPCPARARLRRTPRRPTPMRSKSIPATKKAPIPTPTSTWSSSARS